jgi:hypothetical protein
MKIPLSMHDFHGVDCALETRTPSLRSCAPRPLLSGEVPHIFEATEILVERPVRGAVLAGRCEDDAIGHRQRVTEAQGGWLATLVSVSDSSGPAVVNRYNTSLAFILGVVPLVLGTGAGAEMRQALGTAVFSGMLGVTVFGIFFTPVFYAVVMWFARRPAA